jgi:hypothetical protein
VGVAAGARDVVVVVVVVVLLVVVVVVLVVGPGRNCHLQWLMLLWWWCCCCRTWLRSLAPTAATWATAAAADPHCLLLTTMKLLFSLSVVRWLEVSE